MVNYCCVYGCGRNSRHNKLLKYYTMPKDIHRQILWLKAAGREDLLEVKQENRSNSRFCSRHFEPSSIKNKNLCATAVPTKNLPGSLNDEDDNNVKPPLHHNILCNSCSTEIHGFRYKCVTCPDYDLCPKCEMLGIHPEHYVLRIPKPLKFKAVDELADKWRQFFKVEHVTPDTDLTENISSDDEPITKYVKNYDSGIDLSEDIKIKIRNEVTRVLKVTKDKERENLKRKSFKKCHDIERMSKKQKIQESNKVPEVAFADVNETDSQVVDMKPEVPVVIETTSGGYDTSMKQGYDAVLAAMTFASIDINTSTIDVRFDNVPVT